MNAEALCEDDEKKIGRRKNNCVRIIEGQWVFGGIDRETGDFFIVPVEDRSKDTLLHLSKTRTLPGPPSSPIAGERMTVWTTQVINI